MIFHRLDAQILCEKSIFGVEIRGQIENVLGECVGVGAGDREERPFVSNRVAVVNLCGNRRN